MWRSLGASRRRNGPTAPSGSRAHSASRIKIAAKVDKVDEAYFRETIAPLLDQPGVELHRRDRRTRQERIPGRCARAAVPDRLARAVRTVDDRGHGLRHADPRLPLRLGARDHRSRRHRRDRRHDGRGDRQVARGARARSARGATAIRRTIFRHYAWPRTTFTLYRSLLKRPSPQERAASVRDPLQSGRRCVSQAAA